MFLGGGGAAAASSSDGFWMTYPVDGFLLCSDNASHKCEQCSEIGELHCGGWLVDLDLDVVVVVVVPYSSCEMKVHGVLNEDAASHAESALYVRPSHTVMHTPSLFSQKADVKLGLEYRQPGMCHV